LMDVKAVCFLWKVEYGGRRTVNSQSGLSMIVPASEGILQTAGMGMLKDCWAIQRRRVGSLMDLENSKGAISLGGHKEIAALRRIAESVLTCEVKNTLKNRKGSGVDTSTEVNPDSQKVVDPNRVNPKLLERLKTKIAEIKSALEASEASMRYGESNS
jgi:hypothetical protein